MIKIEKTEVVGWEPAIRGMRNPMNSWEKSDSVFDIERYFASDGDRDCGFESEYGVDLLGNVKEGGMCFGLDDKFQDHVSLGDNLIGPNDLDLMLRLNKGGPVEAKYRRMIVVYTDITAPLYWWKEFDTYKVGTVANSCSTMHKIHSKGLELSDFSIEHLNDLSLTALTTTIERINSNRKFFVESYNKDKNYWWQMIQLLPSSYNQKRTVMMNYEVLAGIYPKRKNHKLDEWHSFCDWIKELPLSEIITGEEEK